MSEPRAQRNVAPPNLPRSGAARQTVRRRASRARRVHRIRSRNSPARSRDIGREQAGRRASPTPDEIHRLRVAARRLRVALRLFGRMLPSKDVGALPCRAALVRELARRRSRSRRVQRELQGLCANAAAEPARRPERLSALPAARARGSAPARGCRVREPARRLAVHEPRAFRRGGPSPAALRRWGSLTVRDAVGQDIRRGAGRVRRSATGSWSARGRGAARAAHQDEALALRARVLRRGLSGTQAAGQGTAKRCRTCSACTKTFTRPWLACAATLRCSVSKARTATLPPALVRTAPQPARARARGAPLFQGEVADFRRDDRRRAATRCLTAGSADA